MNGLVRHLLNTPGITELIVVGGNNFNSWMIEQIIANLRINRISFYIGDQDCVKLNEVLINNLVDKYKTNICKLTINALDDALEYKMESNRVALLFDALEDYKFVYNLKNIQPYILCGAIPRGNDVNTFEVWEIFRNSCMKMYLDTWGENSKDEVLFWEKDDKETIELSIIYPMYNVDEYLQQCIETSTAWKADYVEFLFVDDGSPDGCADIVLNAAKKDPRIKLLRKKNGGCASARQFGLDKARGKYVGFVDPDDYVDETMFQKLFVRAMTGRYNIAYCGYIENHEGDGRIIKVNDLLGEPYSNGTTDNTLILNLCAFCRVAIWRAIYSVEMIKKANIHFYEDIKRYDDLPFKFETFAVSKSVVSVPEYLYYYRIGRDGQDMAADDDRLFVHFQIFKYLDAFVKERGTNDMRERLQIVKFHTHIYALRKIKKEFFQDYLSMAHTDMISLYDSKEGALLVNKYLGNKDLKLFKAIIRERGSIIYQ